MDANAEEVTLEKELKQEGKQEEKEREYPPTKKVLPAIAALYLVVFLVALDRTIVGTAVPRITQQFNSFGDVAWYEAGFLLPLSIFQLSFGRVYTYYSAKWTLAILVAIFEIGSIVCASAPTSAALIVGRAVSGLGAAGITSGAFILITFLVPLESRPKYTGSIGAVFGLASILGPILGGYLTSVTWRWCFWINVPIGGVALVLLVLLTPKSEPAVKPAETWLGKIKELDPLGFILIAPCIICLLFALEWGGVKYPWNSGSVIALFVVFGVLAVAFIAAQGWRKEKATVPPRIFFQRSILAGSFATMGIGSVLVIYGFYLPIWFQVIQGKTPQKSGLSLLPLLLSNVVAVIGGGIATTALGYYTPLLMIGSAILIVGAGLITTWSVTVSAGYWIGYQILAGFGLGMTLQQPNIAAQTVLSDKDVSIGLTLLQFQSLLAGTVFVTISQTLLQNKLAEGLAGIIPNFDPSSVAQGAATSLRDVSPDLLPAVLEIYNDSMRTIWYLALGLACLPFLASFGMEWKSVKKNKNKNKKEAGDTDTEAV